MTEPTFTVYPDQYGLGQRKIAEIRLSIARQDMATAAKEAFDMGYVPPEWRAMQRRLFNAARTEYEAAKEVLKHVGIAEGEGHNATAGCVQSCADRGRGAHDDSTQAGRPVQRKSA